MLVDGGQQCWCFGSNGLQALGQKELVFLLECLPDEKSLPRDLFSLYLNIYEEAQKGETPAEQPPTLRFTQNRSFFFF